MKQLIAILMICSSILAIELTVKVDMVDSKRKGNLLFFVYQKSTWMKVDVPQKKLPVSKGKQAYRFSMSGLTAGEYAVRIVHDEDSDDKLSMKWFPPGPTEGYGFSDDYKPGGIPNYQSAAFDIENDTTITISLQYPKE